jgi:hypothetical protein
LSRLYSNCNPAISLSQETGVLDVSYCIQPKYRHFYFSLSNLVAFYSFSCLCLAENLQCYFEQNDERAIPDYPAQRGKALSFIEEYGVSDFHR